MVLADAKCTSKFWNINDMNQLAYYHICVISEIRYHYKNLS